MKMCIAYRTSSTVNFVAFPLSSQAGLSWSMFSGAQPSLPYLY
jgi:hypothetical protein